MTDSTEALAREGAAEPLGGEGFARPANGGGTAPAANGEGAPTASGDQAAATRRRRSSGGLSAMLLPELQGLASSLGIAGTGRLRKGELIDAIRAAQAGGSAPAAAGATRPEAVADTSAGARPDAPAPRSDAGRSDAGAVAGVTEPAGEAAAPNGRSQDDRGDGGAVREDRGPRQRDRSERQRERGANQQGQQGTSQPAGTQQVGAQQGGSQQGQGAPNGFGRNDRSDRDEDFGGSRSRRARYRERRRGRERFAPGGGQDEAVVVADDDVLIPVAGILDVLDSYGFIRTSGYLPGSNDVYVPLAQVRRSGLRKGDLVTGAVRQPKDGERREKFLALARLDTVNGLPPEEARNRVEFGKLTPLYPQDRLRLETEPNQLTNRIIDLVAPIGKGQRGLIVSPPKAGKTMVLQAIANSITRNNPECHLMVVLVDERPEEVTDMQRSVKGEVIASTFDRPAEDHTTVAELSIERAKRLVELGHDVVVLLDSMTRLGRAYNLAAPASGRILSGGVDSTALYPPKRFFGAARNIENGGSLTILATALVETGSRMDEVIFEEFKGTGNMELKLDRRLADKRLFPAVDVDASGTRKEEILLAPEELQIVWKLRRVLHALEQQQALELVIERLKKTKSNLEFLMQIRDTMPNAQD